MTAIVPRWLGWVWILAGVVTSIGALVGGVTVWTFVGSASELTSQSIASSRDLLAGASETTAAVDEVLSDVAGSLREVQVTLADASLTLTRAAVVVDDLGELVSNEIPSSIDAVTDSMPALVDTAGVVDTAMRGLSFFGVDYDADVPLDDSIEEIALRLSLISPLLRAQDEIMEAVSDDLGYFGGVTTLVSDDVGVIRSRLSRASSVVDDYAQIVETADELLIELDAEVERGRRGMRLTTVLVSFGLAGTASVPVVMGLGVVRGVKRDDG